MVTLRPSPPQPDLDSEESWLRAAAASEAFALLADPAKDIYTPDGGEPFHEAV